MRKMASKYTIQRPTTLRNSNYDCHHNFMCGFVTSETDVVNFGVVKRSMTNKY